jgi:hypothetical protein
VLPVYQVVETGATLFVPARELLLRDGVRYFLTNTFEDMRAGRESWRVLTFLSGLSLGATAFFVWW